MTTLPNPLAAERTARARAIDLLIQPIEVEIQSRFGCGIVLNISQMNNKLSDEEQIITILKNKEGSCEQGTLRVITGFSKATLSRLLSELETRNVIHKEKRGKKNLVFLKK